VQKLRVLQGRCTVVEEARSQCLQVQSGVVEIVPSGGMDDPVNEKGLQFYSDLVDELLANEITPFVTLFHWYVSIFKPLPIIID